MKESMKKLTKVFNHPYNTRNKCNSNVSIAVAGAEGKNQIEIFSINKEQVKNLNKIVNL